MPPTDDAHLDAILAGCHERGVRVILPTRDGELPFWADQQARFAAAGIHVIISSPEAIERCRDKLAFAQFGRDRNLSFIPAATDPDDLGPGPFVVKERFGAGARGIGLNLDRTNALHHAQTLTEPLFQPFVTGREVSIDAWIDRDFRLKGLTVRTRDLVVNGESQVTTTCSDPALETLAANILSALQVRGPVVLQLLLDAHGAPHIIECNPRIGGASTAAAAAGLDLLAWSILEGFGIDVGTFPPPAQGAVRQVRVPYDCHFRLDRGKE